MQSIDDMFPSENMIENKFYSKNNSSKLCAKGAIGNLMNVLHCSEDDMDLFWSIVNNWSMQSICQILDQASVPQVVQKAGQ